MTAGRGTATRWDYHDDEQTIPHRAAYLARLDALTKAGEYPYNDSFKGHISYDGPDEDSMIYQLQGWRRRTAVAEKVGQYLADGWEPVGDFTDREKFAGIVEYGFYMGGTGWHEWADARLVSNGCRASYVLPKGKRTRGHLLTGTILVRR